MAAKKLRSITKREVKIFKIKNRRGFAAIYHGNLTEGRTTSLAIARMRKAVKRIGLLLK